LEAVETAIMAILLKFQVAAAGPLHGAIIFQYLEDLVTP
jgi:hypothetical protein